MKKIILVFTVLGLSACASPVATSNQLHKQQARENSAWDTIGNAAIQTCGFTPGKTVQKSKAVEERRCINGLIDQHLMPIAEFPDNLKTMQGAFVNVAEMYQNGEISAADYKSRMEGISDSYDKAWIRLANERIDNAHNNQRALASYSGAVAAGAQGYNESRQEQFERQQANQPVTVHCTEGLGTYHCQQY